MKILEECSKETQTLEDCLGEIFFNRRTELGLSYKQVEKLGQNIGEGFNYQTVFKLEKGKLRLKPSVLKKIAEVLDFEIPKDLLPKLKPHALSCASTTEFGKRLRFKRLEMELNYVDFGKLLGVSSAVVSGLESGKYNASTIMLAKFSDKFKNLEHKKNDSVQPPTL